jgi:membrane fusion protein, heavy metal efflux system
MQISTDKRKLWGGAAAIALVAAVGGVLMGRSFDSSNQTPAAETAEAGHEEGESGEAHGTEEGGEEGVVALSPEQAQAAGVEVVTPSRGGGGELIVPGRVAFAPGAEAQIGAPLPGIVQQVFVGTGATVSAGTPIALIRSPEAAALRASADSAGADLRAARAAHNREERLFRQRITARQDLEASRAALERAEAALRSARAQIAATGSGSAGGAVTVRAPMAGTVTALAVGPGSALASGGHVATIANTNRLELIFDAPAGSAQTIRSGMAIYANLASGQEVTAVVTSVTPNPANAGAQVRARATSFVPAAGTPLSGRVLTGDAATITVPADAVQNVEGRSVVFVADGESFRAVPVVTGRSAGGRTEILRGLDGDERIAGRGAFLLKAELSRGEAEHEH